MNPEALFLADWLVERLRMVHPWVLRSRAEAGWLILQNRTFSFVPDEASSGNMMSKELRVWSSSQAFTLGERVTVWLVHSAERFFQRGSRLPA